MKSNIKVTIGLCVKNAELTIKEAIDSILDQNFPHKLMELIVVDGCSKGKTLEIIKKSILKTDIKCKILHENKGLGAARQIVVDNASGDYIVWVDADMILSNEYVRKQVDFMERNPAIGIAKGKYEMCNGVNLVATLEDIEFVVNGFKYEGKVTSNLTLGTSGCIYRVESIKQVGGFDENIKGVGEDMDAEYRIRAAGWLLYITDAVFYEVRRKTWKSLWDQYFWHGYGGHYVVHKNSVRALSTLHRMFPPAAILDQVLLSFDAYRLTHRKAVFLLPFHWAFKRIAWFLGFAKSHMKGHGHA